MLLRLYDGVGEIIEGYQFQSLSQEIAGALSQYFHYALFHIAVLHAVYIVIYLVQDVVKGVSLINQALQVVH